MQSAPPPGSVNPSVKAFAGFLTPQRANLSITRHAGKSGID
jgi:hypothetical protein